jgi:hypothetical protein
MNNVEVPYYQPRNTSYSTFDKQQFLHHPSSIQALIRTIHHWENPRTMSIIKNLRSTLQDNTCSWLDTPWIEVTFGSQQSQILPIQLESQLWRICQSWNNAFLTFVTFSSLTFVSTVREYIDTVYYGTLHIDVREYNDTVYYGTLHIL